MHSSSEYDNEVMVGVVSQCYTAVDCIVFFLFVPNSLFPWDSQVYYYFKFSITSY